MNILQYFHKKETLPPFNKGDKVKLKDVKGFENLVPLYNKYNTRFPTSIRKMIESRNSLIKHYFGEGVHIVRKVTEGTPAAGGWFVYVDGIDLGFHGNIFELAN